MISFGVTEGLFLRGALFLDILIRDYDYGEALHRESHRRDSLRFNLQVNRFMSRYRPTYVPIENRIEKLYF